MKKVFFFAVTMAVSASAEGMRGYGEWRSVADDLLAGRKTLKLRLADNLHTEFLCLVKL